MLGKPSEPAAERVRRVAFRHKVVLTAELPGAMQFDLFEDALAVGVVDDAQVAFVGRHDGEARGAVSVRGVTSGADPEPDGDPRASIAHAIGRASCRERVGPYV